MKQPELGKKIADMRKQNGLTQAELAFETNINVRSIQRIEAGEVTPRLSTLKLLSQKLGFEFNGHGTKEADFWLLLMHLSSVMPIVVVALIIWIWKREEVPEIEEQGVDVLNFQISMCIYLFVAAMPLFLVIGIIILPVLGIFIFFISVVNTVKVALGQRYHYPLTIAFFKRQGSAR